MSGPVPGPGAGAAAITVMSVSMICSAIKYTGYQDTHTRQIWRTSTEMKRVAGLGCRFNSSPLNSKYSGAIENRHTYYLSGSHVSQDIVYRRGRSSLASHRAWQSWHRTMASPPFYAGSSIYSDSNLNIIYLDFFKYWNSDLAWKIFVSSLSAAHSFLSPVPISQLAESPQTPQHTRLAAWWGYGVMELHGSLPSLINQVCVKLDTL